MYVQLFKRIKQIDTNHLKDNIIRIDVWYKDSWVRTWSNSYSSNPQKMCNPGFPGKDCLDFAYINKSTAFTCPKLAKHIHQETFPKPATLPNPIFNNSTLWIQVVCVSSHPNNPYLKHISLCVYYELDNTGRDYSYQKHISFCAHHHLIMQNGIFGTCSLLAVKVRTEFLPNERNFPTSGY